MGPRAVGGRSSKSVASPLRPRTPLFAAMGNEAVLESVQVFGRKVSWQGGAMAAPFAQRGEI